jgi:hypothetical protein
MLEVYRRPSADRDAPLGFRYADVQIVPDGGTVSPLAAPHAQIAVTDLLP